MYEKNITNKEQGQRLDKMLQKILPEAGTSFLYKMLRKKNIKLNNQRAEGKEILQEGDLIQIYFSDETLQKFMGKNTNDDITQYQNAYKSMHGIEIVYEDENYVFVNKPSGYLTQKAETTDLSLNEWLIGYLLDSQKMKAADLVTFKPSACNRLDRNTSGLVLCAKTVRGAQILSQMLKDRSLEKYYLAYVAGCVSKAEHISGYLIKDHKTNQVKIVNVDEVTIPKIASSTEKYEPKDMFGNTENPETKDKTSDARKSLTSEKAERIETAFKPLLCTTNKKTNQKQTLLLVDLITGKSHQIRAHLASRKAPIIGDIKYGNTSINKKYKDTYRVDSQMLHAYCVRFPVDCEDVKLAGMEFKTNIPKLYRKITDCELGEASWQLGVLED